MAPYVPRLRKHKARQDSGDAKNGKIGRTDSNSLEIHSTSAEQNEKKEKLKKETTRAGQSNMSSKKQRRMERYIVGKRAKILSIRYAESNRIRNYERRKISRLSGN